MKEKMTRFQIIHFMVGIALLVVESLVLAIHFGLI